MGGAGRWLKVSDRLDSKAADAERLDIRPGRCLRTVRPTAEVSGRASSATQLWGLISESCNHTWQGRSNCGTRYSDNK